MHLIALIEDSPTEAELIQEYCKRFCTENSVNIDVKWFPKGETFLRDYQPIYDLVLMDINLPALNGMDTAARLRADEDCLAQLGADLAARAVAKDGGWSIPAAALAEAPEPIALRAVQQLLARLRGDGRDCAAAHWAALLRLCRTEDPSARLSLPHGLTARREYEAALRTWQEHQDDQLERAAARTGSYEDQLRIAQDGLKNIQRQMDRSRQTLAALPPPETAAPEDEAARERETARLAQLEQEQTAAQTKVDTAQAEVDRAKAEEKAVQAAAQAGPQDGRVLDCKEALDAAEEQQTRAEEALAAAQAEQKAVESKQEAPTAEKPKTVQPANKPKTRKEAEEELAQNIHDDHLWLNNPVMVRGLGLAPIVAAAVSGQNAWMLCAAAILLVTATRMLAVAICHLTGNRFRGVVYSYAAAIVYIPAYIILYNLFGADLSLLGIYLPMLVVEPAVIKRMESNDLETVGEAFRRGINNTIGICFSVLLVGVVRELLAEGTVFGNVVFPVAPLPLADQPGTGFIIIGLIAAVWTAIGGAYVHYKIEEVRHLYGNKRKR